MEFLQIQITPNQVPIPDQYFWYLLATVLATAIIWIMARNLNKTEKLLEKVVEDIQVLKSSKELHEHRIEEIEEKQKMKTETFSEEVAMIIISKLKAISA